MKQMIASLVVMILAAAVSPSAVAQTGWAKAQTRDEFAAQRARIETLLADGRTYSEIEPEQRHSVQQSMQNMAALFERQPSTQAMSPEDKVALFNEQERVNTLLTRAAEDSRTVCQRERRVGSQVPITRCMTVAERRQAKEQSRDAAERMQRKNGRVEL